MEDKIQEFIEAMAAEGIALANPAEIIADDQVHRAHVVGDKPNATSLSYKLGIGEDGFAFGWFTPFRFGNEAINWHSKPGRGQTKQVKARSKQWHDERRAERERVVAEALAVAVAQSGDLMDRSEPADGHPYLVRKGVAWADLRQADGLLLVPIVSDDGPRGCQLIAVDGKRWFVTGSRKSGAWHLIATDGDSYDRVFISEGLSTGLTIRNVSGCPVYVAIDAGNMKMVCEAVRRRHPQAQIIVAGDNDIWTRDQKGQPMNTGRRAAEQAAVACGGHMWLPEGLEYPATDWNDAAAANGLDWVAAEVAKIPMPSVAVVTEDIGDYYDLMDAPDTALPTDKLTREIRPQGYAGKKYYFFPRSTGDIEEFVYSEFGSDTAYYHLAEESFWHQFFDEPDKVSGKDVVRMFKGKVMQACKRKGKFDPERVLSTGIWPDGKGGVVANLGNTLYVPSMGFVDHSEYESENVYISAPKSLNIDVPPMKNAEAVKLRKICEGLSWRYKISGSLLAGWIYAAIMSGALRWRPHIFVTGGKGSGKTTVMKYIIKAVLSGWSTNADGGSTGAGFRRKLGNKAVPVVSDEMETETQKQRATADDVLTLARQSSSGAEYSNAYGDITVHSCFCFGGINPNIKHGADKDRITEMELIKDRSDGFRERWKAMEREIKSTIGHDYGRRLARRAIDNAEAFLANVEVFEDALAEMLGDSRSAEQFAPMIAGLYALHSTGVIGADRAKTWVREQDWDFFHQEEEGSDAEKMVSHLLTAMADFTVGDRTNKISVSEMIDMVVAGGVQSSAAAASLGRYGLRIDNGWLIVANTKSRIGELMRDTSWTVPKNTLSRYPGAVSVDTTRFAAGVVSRGIKIPLAGLIDGFDVVDETGDDSPF